MDNLLGMLGNLITLFLLALLTGGVLVQAGGSSVKDAGAVVFEVYRYTVCFVMLLIFGIGAFTVINTLLAGGDGSSAALAGQGVMVLLAGAIFALHWRLKAPAGSA